MSGCCDRCCLADMMFTYMMSSVKRFLANVIILTDICLNNITTDRGHFDSIKIWARTARCLSVFDCHNNHNCSAVNTTTVSSCSKVFMSSRLERFRKIESLRWCIWISFLHLLINLFDVQITFQFYLPCEKESSLAVFVWSSWLHQNRSIHNYLLSYSINT